MNSAVRSTSTHARDVEENNTNETNIVSNILSDNSKQTATHKKNPSNSRFELVTEQLD